MFGRRKGGAPASTTTVERPGAKNRPTPKRSVAEAANKRPLVPNDRKAAGKNATKANREQLREQRIRQRQAMLTGDERYLPARDAGPERRFIRDYIDARYNIGELMLPVVALVFALSLTRSGYVILVVTVAVYALILAAIFDAVFLRIRLRKLLTAKFGSMPRGSVFYGITRSLQIRRWRMPRPKVARREYPS
jgi:Protein of unknown function (DUF3043)